MHTVWKASHDPRPGVAVIEVPEGAELLSAREQHDQVAIWFRCDPEAPKTQRRVALCMTGSPAPTAEQGRYLGSALFDHGRFVLHVFEPLN